MKYFSLASFFLLLFLAGCAIFRQQPSNTYFSFEFEGETYEILGFTEENGESANFLVKRTDDSTMFRAIDRSQNGIIEQIIIGSIDLKRANLIYQEGIRMARETDRFEDIDRFREFEAEHEEYRLVVQSYKRNASGFMNRLILYDLNWSVLAIYWDENSDGILNRSEFSDIETDEAQRLYELLLEKASDNDRIERRFENRFIITTGDPVDEINQDYLSE